MKKFELRQLLNEVLTEGKYEVYHSTFSSAINEIERYIKNLHYYYDEDEFVNAFIDGFFKPKPGKTKKDSITLFKNGKEQRKAFHSQIYNRGVDDKTYELNMYVS